MVITIVCANVSGMGGRTLVLQHCKNRAIVATWLVISCVSPVGVIAEIVDEIRPVAECRGHERTVTAIVFSPDSQRLYSSGVDKSVRRWSIDGREQQPAFTEHTAAVNAISISRDGKRLASGGRDSKISVWDVATGKAEYVIDTDAEVLCVGLVQAGQIVAAGCGNSRLRNWRLNGPTAEPGSWNMANKITSITVCPDDKTGCNCWGAPWLQLADLAGVASQQRGSSTGHNVVRSSVAGDGRAVMIIDKGGIVRVLNWDRFETMRMRAFPLANRLFGQMSSRSSFAVIAVKGLGSDPVISVWDLVNNRIVANLSGPPEGMTDLALSADDTHVAISGEDGRIVIWSLEGLLPELKESDITPLLGSVEKLNAIGKDAIKLPNNWLLVPLNGSKIPYLQNAGAYAFPGDPGSLGITATTKRDMPLYLIVDWTYSGTPEQREQAFREYRRQLTASKWIELQTCPWNRDASIFMHAQTAAGEKEIPFINRLFPIIPQVAFSTDFTDASATDREKFPASAQQRMMHNDIARMLESKDWNGLEVQSKTLRKERKTFANGVSRLWTFYSATSGSGPTKARETLLNEWIKAKPTSAAAKLSLAVVRIDAGWNARGGDIAERVTDSGASALEKQMQAAQKLAKDAEKNASDDPMVEWCLLESMRGLGATPDKFKSVALQGLKKDPWFTPITESITFSLLPRWYGDERDAEDYALKVRDGLKGDAGLVHYALVAEQIMSVERGGWEKKFHFAGELIQRGLTVYQEKYPESIFAKNMACWMACHEERYDDARKLFAEIGFDFDARFWRGFPVFDEFRESVRAIKPDRLRSRILAHHYFGLGLAVSHDSNFVATCGLDPGMCLFDIETGKKLEEQDQTIEACDYVAFQSDDEVVARKATDIIHWKVKDDSLDRVRWTIPSQSDVIALSPDGTTMVAAPNQGKIKLHAFDTQTGKSKFQVSAQGKLSASFPVLSFSPDGTRLVHTDLTKAVTIFDMVKGKVLSTLEVNDGRVLAAACFDDGKKVGAILEDQMVEWDVATRKVTWSQDRNERFGDRLAISPDGRWWAITVFQAGERLAGRALLWDRKANDGWHPLPEIRTRTNQMAFTRDSKKLMTLSASGFLRIWNLND